MEYPELSYGLEQHGFANAIGAAIQYHDDLKLYIMVPSIHMNSHKFCENQLATQTFILNITIARHVSHAAWQPIQTHASLQTKLDAGISLGLSCHRWLQDV